MRHTASVAAICRAVLEAVLYATTDCICIVDECNLCTTRLKARTAYKYRGPTARGCTCGYYFELRAVLLTVSAEPLLLWQIPHENPSPPLTSSHWTYTLPLAPSPSTTPGESFALEYHHGCMGHRPRKGSTPLARRMHNPAHLVTPVAAQTDRAAAGTNSVQIGLTGPNNPQGHRDTPPAGQRLARPRQGTENHPR